MAKRLLIFLHLIFMVTAFSETKDSYIHGEFMTLEEADRKWGHTSFTQQEYIKSPPDKRASLIVSLVQSKKLNGASMEDVRKLLGPPDGYFIDDTIPAYLLGTRKPGQTNDVWQIVFIPNEERTKVIEIKIHKNCCYKD